MELASEERFSSRVQTYSRYRPTYPQALLHILERECGLTVDSKVADIGSGTGLLSGLFREFGCDVTGVEPNADMRAEGERKLSRESRFHSVDGRAEATTLAERSIDFVTAGQAFHWFDPLKARTEFQRILKSRGWVVLVWNERVPTPGFMAEHQQLQRKVAREKAHPSKDELNAFYGNQHWRLARAPHSQTLDEDGLRGRMESSSWSPKPGDEGYDAMVQELSRLFRKYERGGQVTIEYETEMYYGRL